jgi:hypothetical protein
MEKKVIEKRGDSGVRAKFNGEIYVDKKVFYKRKDVRKTIEYLMNSQPLKEHIKRSRREVRNEDQVAN